jgi:branched-chain amino acid transport system ATP-binding protein
LDILRVEGLSKSFGGLAAVSKVSFSVETGKITGLIGPNGSGKTTTFNIISGLLKPDSGKIIFEDKNVTGYPPHKLCSLGIGRTFQNLLLFKSMTVVENAMVGCHCCSNSGLLASGLRLPSVIKEEARLKKQTIEMLEYVGLGDWANKPASDLPFGTQRALEIVRALATRPKLLLLDEPATGLNPSEVKDLRLLLLKIRNEMKISTLIIEHNMRLIMSASDFVVVLDHGEKIAEGTPQGVQQCEAVIQAYLGRGNQKTCLK